MASNSFLDKPLLKVSRPVAACSRCRTAKIKCDGKLPACSACERVGKANTCSGASDEFARGKERSYVASLEGYCERLEKRIAELRRRKESLAADGAGFVRESSITSNSSDSASHTHRKEVSDIDDLVGDFGFLSVNATSRDFHGISSSASFANLLLSLSMTKPLLPSSSTLPPRHEITLLLQHYFDYLYPQLPFFSETSFWTSVDIIYQSGGRFAKPTDHWFLRMVLAIASASTSYRIGDQNYRRALSFVSGALQYAEDVLRPGSVTGIQTIILLAQYSFLDPTHFRPWYLVGMAVRVMLDLGFHQDPPSEDLPSQERLDMRRRVFHCVYYLDRGVSTALERTFSLSDESVNVALPSKSSRVSNPVFLHSSDPAWHLVKIRQILSTAYQKKYIHGYDASLQSPTSTWRLCAKAQEWFNTIPRESSVFFPILCRLELLYTIVIILSPTGSPATSCDYDKVLLFDHCIHFIDEVYQILRAPDLLVFLTSIDIQRVFQVGQRLLDLLRHDYDVVLNPSEPELPPVPPDVPSPPALSPEDRINCHGRAIDCVAHTKNLLVFGVERWQLKDLFQAFQDESADINDRLTQPPVPYFIGDEPYFGGQAAPVLAPGSGYVNYDFGQFGSWEA
ncbi:fungal-specific transcription factor domain-containing protein [Aspergillus ambiguus]|uniref:Zn(II)2Cys6 transcription factor n=1 Tax=Aspergillus ambiguus TaxID=176160 RepID=UPI003CCD2D4E